MALPAALVVVAATAAVSPAAQARALPRPVVMTASGGQQPGVLVESVTHRGDGRRCATAVTAGRAAQPAAVAHDGRPLSWRIPDRRRPDTTTLRMYYLSVREDTSGVRYEAMTTMPLKLAPVRSRGQVVAWTATTDGDVRIGDYDIRFRVLWAGACGNDSVEYRFHARSLPAHP